MAKGRMLNRSISTSAKFQALPDDTCRLLATWTIPQLDINGVFHGEPAIVKSYIFPYRTDITVEQVREYLKEMQAVGLIVFFEARGQLWQLWTGFSHNQPYLRKDKEGKSDFPTPPDSLPTIPDLFPTDSNANRLKGREEKGREEKGKEGNTFPPPPSADIADSTAQIVASEEVRNSEPVLMWRRKVRRPLTPEAANYIFANVTDLEKWGAVLDCWLVNGYKEENVMGQVSMYGTWDTDRRNPKNQRAQPAANGKPAPVSYFGEGGVLDQAMNAVWGEMGASNGN